MAVPAWLSPGSWWIMYKDFEKVIFLHPRSSAFLWPWLQPFSAVLETQKLQKSFPWTGAYRPWPRHLSSSGWIILSSWHALSFSRLQIILAVFRCILSNLSAYFLNWGSKKWTVCSSRALANASQSGNFPFHFSWVFPSHAAMDYFSTLTTWLVWEPISSQLSIVKTLPGHCLLKYSPNSCHWYLHKNIPAAQLHLQQFSPLLKCVLPKGARAAVPMESSEGLPFVPLLHTNFLQSSPWGVFGPCLQRTWWEQDHEQAPCEIPVSTLHWDTAFLAIITFWDLSISWFLSLLVGICNALCTEILGFFEQNVIHYRMKCLAVSSLAMLLLLSVKCISKKKQYQVQQKYCSVLICLYIQKSNQSAKPWQIRKYIQLFKFSKKNLLFIQFAMYLKTERFFLLPDVQQLL